MKLHIIDKPPKPPPKKPAPNARQLAYVEKVACGETKTGAAIAAGYSPSTGTAWIDRAVGTSLAKKAIDEQRAIIAQTEPGCSFVEVIRRTRDRSVTSGDPGIQLDNDKFLVKLLGYEAPQKTEVRTMSLIAELGVLSKEDLAALCGLSNES